MWHIDIKPTRNRNDKQENHRNPSYPDPCPLTPVPLRTAARIAKLSALLLAGALLLFGCGSSGGQSETPSNQPPSQQERPPDREPFAFTRENFPRMDGSTSTGPLAEAVACVLLGEPREAVAELVVFNRTTESFRHLAAGICDILIVSEPTPEVFSELRAQGFELDMAPIALDALVFIVNASNPVDNLTTEQIRGIYTGRITNWRDVGGHDIPIEAFQRNAEAGSQVLMEKLVMDGRAMADAPMQHIHTAFGMGAMLTAMRGFDGSANAIGYTVFYFARDMGMAEGMKIISVDGVSPGTETIRSGEYPFVNPYFVVIGASEPEDSPARIMWNWLLGDEGQALVAHEGYVPMR